MNADLQPDDVRMNTDPRGPCPHECCLLYTSDAADERSSVDLGGRRIIKKKTRGASVGRRAVYDIHTTNSKIVHRGQTSNTEEDEGTE
mgnify:CR=1 FL=1